MKKIAQTKRYLLPIGVCLFLFIGLFAAQPQPDLERARALALQQAKRAEQTEYFSELNRLHRSLWYFEKNLTLAQQNSDKEKITSATEARDRAQKKYAEFLKEAHKYLVHKDQLRWLNEPGQWPVYWAEQEAQEIRESALKKELLAKRAEEKKQHSDRLAHALAASIVPAKTSELKQAEKAEKKVTHQDIIDFLAYVLDLRTDYPFERFFIIEQLLNDTDPAHQNVLTDVADYVAHEPQFIKQLLQAQEDYFDAMHEMLREKIITVVPLFRELQHKQVDALNAARDFERARLYTDSLEHFDYGEKNAFENGLKELARFDTKSHVARLLMHYREQAQKAQDDLFKAWTIDSADAKSLRSKLEAANTVNWEAHRKRIARKQATAKRKTKREKNRARRRSQSPVVQPLPAVKHPQVAGKKSKITEVATEVVPKDLPLQPLEVSPNLPDAEFKTLARSKRAKKALPETYINHMLEKFNRSGLSEAPQYNDIQRRMQEANRDTIDDTSSDDFIVINDTINHVHIALSKTAPKVSPQKYPWFLRYKRNIGKKNDVYHLFSFITDIVCSKLPCIESQENNPQAANEVYTRKEFAGEIRFLDDDERVVTREPGVFEYFFNQSGDCFHRWFRKKAPIAP